ncbi:DUF2804 domain-containing protein [Shewanella corallii]|uniref:DUF2804 domain-containing protein n=1 Tax=Shewanella corallii TaxID=560080 RepID=A0ABT0N2U8_9GAMM|nr:DUF2804 domain-containing protein [Shewanella corallii]MCL2912660.1 DUF2804 domain-containing protein [Shewanella corallii]
MTEKSEGNPTQPGKAPLQTQKPPESLIDNRGRPCFGYFDGPVTYMAPDRFDYRNVMDKPASAWSRHFHYKQFQFVSVVTRGYVLGMALADIRYLGSGFAYLLDIRANRLTEINWLKPKGGDYRTTPSPVTGQGHIRGGKGDLNFSIEDGRWRVRLDSEAVRADISLEAPALGLPLAICNPTGYNGWTYTQKHNGLQVTGLLEVEGERVSLDSALAGYDFSAGYMRRDTSWRWASINGEVDGNTLGLNLAAGVNETGLNENAFWFNGERHLLGPVQFEFERLNPDSPWRIYSLDGRIELSFHPRNRREEKLNLWLLRSNFRQFIGHFSGRIIDGNGHCHQLNNLVGLTEDHYARW